MSVCDERCLRCDYGFVASNPQLENYSLPACEYLLRTGGRRPCEAGERCTQFVERCERGGWAAGLPFLFGSRL